MRIGLFLDGHWIAKSIGEVPRLEDFSHLDVSSVFSPKNTLREG